jgi:DnaJ-class molecular chaperone
MRLANPLIGHSHVETRPTFEARPCPVCEGAFRARGCETCRGTGFVKAPSGLYAVIIAGKVKRGAIP